MSQNQGYLDFDEYIRQGEPSKREAAYAWSTAIGLQAVDGLKTSEYLNELARRNIEGEITIEEVGELLDSYYESKTVREPDDDDKEEADKGTGQAEVNTPTSTRQVPDKLKTKNPDIERLVRVIGGQQLSVKEMLISLELKDRENFLDVYLSPAISEGYVRLLYPEKPHHPRQKYLLTVKGSLLFNELINLEN